MLFEGKIMIDIFRQFELGFRNTKKILKESKL